MNEERNAFELFKQETWTTAYLDALAESFKHNPTMAIEGCFIEKAGIYADSVCKIALLRFEEPKQKVEDETTTPTR